MDVNIGPTYEKKSPRLDRIICTDTVGRPDRAVGPLYGTGDNFLGVHSFFLVVSNDLSKKNGTQWFSVPLMVLAFILKVLALYFVQTKLAKIDSQCSVPFKGSIDMFNCSQ